jgi:hypothetical protein
VHEWIAEHPWATAAIVTAAVAAPLAGVAAYGLSHMALLPAG